MKTLEEIKNTLAQHKEELCDTYKVKEIGVFGSVVRGEGTETSDIDILADFEDGADLLNLVGLALFLEEKLGRKVDVVSRRTLRSEIRDSVMQEVIPL